MTQQDIDALAAYDALSTYDDPAKFAVAEQLAEALRARVQRDEQAAAETKALVRAILDEFKSEDEEIAGFLDAFRQDYPEVPRYELERLAGNIKQVTRTSELQRTETIEGEES